MRLHAFEGLRYALPEAGALAAPPFDQIDDATRDRFHRVPHHFAHLTRPVAAEHVSPAVHAAALHQAWLAEGIIARDPEPRLYGYAIDLPHGQRRWGLTALVGLEPDGSPVVRPHERTVERTVEERLALLAATQVDLEPIMLLADDGGALERLLVEDGMYLNSSTAHVDEFGNCHRLWPLASWRTSTYREALAPAAALIADGHHRYRTAVRYAAENRITQGPGAAKLAVITSLASPALTIDPIHRGVTRSLPPTQNQFLRSRRPSPAATGAALAAEVAAAPQPALGVANPRGRAEIWQLDATALPPDIAPGAAQLPAVLLDRLLLPAWGLPSTAATDGTLVYRSDPDQLWRAVAGGELAAGIWLPPMTPDAFHAAVADGGLLPPKSTRFLPKVASGLVWCPHDARLG